jgi:hypothetical protein
MCLPTKRLQNWLFFFPRTLPAARQITISPAVRQDFARRLTLGPLVRARIERRARSGSNARRGAAPAEAREASLDHEHRGSDQFRKPIADHAGISRSTARGRSARSVDDGELFRLATRRAGTCCMGPLSNPRTVVDPIAALAAARDRLLGDAGNRARQHASPNGRGENVRSHAWPADNISASVR